MKILVFGKTGQVARELRLHACVTCLRREEADLQRPDICKEIIASSNVDAVINAAAYTAVDAAESDPETAMAVNATAPAAMAAATAARGIPFVHISTDYVFDGTGHEPRTPDDETGPLSVYGATKLAGEKAIAAAGGTYAILRTSWVFSAHGSNFVKTMLRLGAERGALSIVCDQIGGPTPARDIARACLSVARQLSDDPGKTGTYHYAGAPAVSWADFAREIFACADKQVDVTDIPTTAFPTPAKRPLNSRLDCRSLQRVFGLKPADWRTGLEHVLQDLKSS